MWYGLSGLLATLLAVALHFYQEIVDFFADMLREYSLVAEPPFRCGESHHSGPTEPLSV